jgi:hypothetical protein
VTGPVSSRTASSCSPRLKIANHDGSSEPIPFSGHRTAPERRW